MKREDFSVELWKRRKTFWIGGGASVGIIVGILTKSIVWGIMSFVVGTFAIPVLVIVLVIILSALTER